ncbi:hypothetical protein Pint_03907 [Pistacia integerrima]|uniref:Uncharacterized protein n=1 Tax=Pistacia integerrima TaxID=434235 RepID=A0ACC0Z5X5_9ROSI|nr:hypothetical protein Pint_03907 [Pistacia integerrima]
MVGIRIRAVLVAMVYNKGLTLPCQAKQERTILSSGVPLLSCLWPHLVFQHLCVGLIEEYDSPSKLLENKSSSFVQLAVESTVRSNSSFEK